MTTYFATKYDSAACEVIALLADEMEGFGHASFGDVEASTGYVQAVTLDESCDLDFSDTSTNYPLGDEVGETARDYGVTSSDVIGHHLVTTNSQGFVYVSTYDTRTELDAVIGALETEWAEWDDEETA